MALIDALKRQLENAQNLLTEIDEKRAKLNADYHEQWHYVADLDTAIAALESIPTPEEIGLALDEIEAAEAPAQPDPLSAELRSVPGAEEESRDQFEDEPEPSLFDEDDEDELAEPEIERGATIYAQHEAMQAAGFEPVGNPEDDGPIQWRVKDEPPAEPEPSELDAEPASVLDNPELLAAVERAEATLAIDAQTCEPINPYPQPAYVGLQDAELDAEYEAMKQREHAERKKHFSIFGHRKLEEVS